ncbi:MAG TPA: SDR family oxidoreductase [Bacteroidia bacterium]|nr:SDR family oxidoreductase [Bacteroidia bacterium]
MILNNKVIWITGASAGIGEALALELSKQGAKIILSARREEELLRVQKKCRLNNTNSLILTVDLADTTKINALTEKIISKFGKIDILINNGGVSQRSYANETPLSVDRKVMETNFFGTIAITKSVLPFMLKQKSGMIVVISSISGKFGFYLRSAYCASKHALHGFFDSLRMEIYKENVNILIVCPGRIQTNISLNAMNEKGEKFNKMDASTALGVNTDACAQKIISAMKKEKEEIYIGGKELQAVYLKRFVPNIFSKIIRKMKVE